MTQPIWTEAIAQHTCAVERMRMHNALIEYDNRNLGSFLPNTDDRFEAIFDAVNDGIFISDPNTGQFIEINQAGCQMFGYTRADILGRDVDTLSSGIHPHTRSMAIELNEKARLGEPQIFEWQCRRQDGVLFWTEMSLRYVEFGHTPAIVSIVRDISERKRLDAQIVYMAQHDVLTGLANRSMFAAALDRSIAQSLRTGRKFAILALDLDHFKDVNDARGHLIGDQLLQLVAERLKADVRVDEMVARFGGDEFAILLAEMRRPDEIAALADRLLLSISQPYLIEGENVHVGASIGVAVYGQDSCDAETMLSNADVALYRAKADGRQSYRFFSETMNEEVRTRVKLTNELRLAIPNGQLFLEYQPQVRVEGRLIIGVEALVRWRHPKRGVLMPASFLPVAESSGFLGAIDQWVLREACRQGQEWLASGMMPGPISVNLSSAEFRAPLVLENIVLAILEETGLPPHLLELEITENTLISLSAEHADMMQRLRHAGVRIALDDFGTGYSSLNYLRGFGIDRIKIAKEFISEVATSVEAASIIKLILGLARDFGNEVIAEGVETFEQLSLLQAWNCPDIQGFYFAKPMSSVDIAPLLIRGTICPATSKAHTLAA